MKSVNVYIKKEATTHKAIMFYDSNYIECWIPFSQIENKTSDELMQAPRHAELNIKMPAWLATKNCLV